MTINFKFPFSRFIVNEESMIPTYKPGDHVLTFNWGKIKKGDVVVFSFLTRHPALDAGSSRIDSRFSARGGSAFGGRGNDKDEDKQAIKGLFYIKRIDKITGDLVNVVGDNRKESAKVGPIVSEQIIGKVVIKY